MASDSAPAAEMDLEKIQKFLYSLEVEEYIRFMNKVHFHCPFKKKWITEDIMNHWKNDHSMKTEEFNAIIENRKEEHIQEAREKREGDLRRIQKRKSKTGVDPLQLFPKEIWMMMLEQLPPEDKHNIREVHETFRDLTEDTLVGAILLPIILSFKVERFWGDQSQSPGVTHAVPVSPLAHFTELRLVSKSMRNAIDHCFEQDLLTELQSGNKNAYCPSRVVHIKLLQLKDCRKFARISEDLQNPSSAKPSRFFTRSLALISPEKARDLYFPSQAEQDEWAKFLGYIDDLLDHVGDQIWYFSFDFTCPHPIYAYRAPGFSACWISLMGWLSKLPNLKWLKFTLKQTEKEYSDCRDSWIPRDYVPPPLRHLERLDLELKEKNRYILPAYSQLLTAYSQVKMLNLVGMKSVFKEKNGFVVVAASESESDLKPANSIKTPLNIETLIMDGSTSVCPSRRGYNSWDYQYERDHDDNDDDGFNDDKLIHSIIQSKWPLRRIDWELVGSTCVYTLFRVLESVQTLEKIRLSMEDVIIRQDIAFLKLPQLTHFELKFKNSGIGDKPKINWSFFYSLQFLVFAKKLKSLIWKCDMKEKLWAKMRDDAEGIEQEGEMLDLHRFVLDLFGYGSFSWDIIQSNMWSAFPWLEEINLELVDRNDDNSVKETLFKTFRRRELDFSKPSERHQKLAI